MIVSSGDVARVAGVSRSQVSNFFNHPHLVSATTASNIQAAVEQLGYVRSASARMLRSGTHNAIGLMLLDAWAPYFGQVSQGVEDEVYAHGWSLHFTNTRRDPERELRHLDFYESWKVPAVIIAPQQDLGARLIRLMERGMTPVLLDPHRTIKVPRRIPSVHVDHVEGGRIAAQHLVEAGGTRFAFVGNPQHNGHTGDRIKGFRAGLRSAAVRSRVRLIETEALNIEWGSRAAAEVLALDAAARPDAIMTGNDETALGLVLALVAAGVRVPDDILVIGYDDLPIAHQVTLPLTTVRQPAYELGQTAARMALREVAEPGVHERRITLSPELVVRSTA